MDCWVDAGEIVRVCGKDARDCALLAWKLLGDRTQFPITVRVEGTGELIEFARPEEVRRTPPRSDRSITNPAPLPKRRA